MRDKIFFLLGLSFFVFGLGKHSRDHNSHTKNPSSIALLERSFTYAKSIYQGKQESTKIKSVLEKDTLLVVILNYPMNCCIDSIGCEFELLSDTLSIRISEYLFELCECFTKFDISLKLNPVQSSPSFFRIYKNKSPKPYLETEPE